jgi:hypothetical protein
MRGEKKGKKEEKYLEQSGRRRKTGSTGKGEEER